MDSFQIRTLIHITILLLLSFPVHGAWDGEGNRFPWSNGDSEWEDCPPWWSSNGCKHTNGDGNGGGGQGTADPSQYGLTLSEVSSTNRIITIHATLACLVWAFLIPLGAILLRIGIKSPWIIRIHALLQISSYLVYTAAVGLGIWLVTQLSYGPFTLWNDSHPKLGVVILALAFLQPVLGFVHHHMFKHQSQNNQQAKSKSRSGRTIPGHTHIWIGRILIVLGIVNGGLGLRLSSRSPFAENQQSKIIAYSVCTALIFVAYAIIVILFEIRKPKQNSVATHESEVSIDESNGAPESQLPSYDQSEESFHKEESLTARQQ